MSATDGCVASESMTRPSLTICDHTQPSRDWSRRCKKPFLRLTASAKVAWYKGKLSHRLSRSQFYAHTGISRGKLGIGKARTRTDKCIICRAWDTVVVTELKQKVTEATEALSALLPSYWNNADFGWDNLDLPSQWQSAIGYVSSHRLTHKRLRQDLSDADRLHLEHLEDHVVESLEACKADCSLWSLHFSLRTLVKDAYHRDRQDPPADACCCVSDCMEQSDNDD